MKALNQIGFFLMLTGVGGSLGCSDSRGTGTEKHEHDRESASRSDKKTHDGDKHDGDKHDGDEHDGDEHDDHDETGRVLLDPKMAKRIGLTTETVKRRPLPAELSTTGEVDFDRDALAHVSARLPGRVADVLKTLGDDVDRGDWLVVLDSIELGQAKAAYLQAKAA